MRGFIPPKPSGSDREALNAQAMWEANFGAESEISNSRTVKVNSTTKGTFFEVVPSVGGIGIATYRFKSQQNDYIVCRAWQGSAEGTTDVKIAKPPELWFSVTSETLYGTAFTYSAYDLTGQSRTATWSGGTENQRIVRPYVLNDLIWAIRANSFVTASGETIKLIDLNRAARAWTQFA